MGKVFDFGEGPVPAHRHANGGGWVANTAEVEDTAVVEEDGQRVYPPPDEGVPTYTLVYIPLAAIADRMAKYGLAEPLDGVRAIMREHCEMWLDLDNQGGLRNDVTVELE